MDFFIDTSMMLNVKEIALVNIESENNFVIVFKSGIKYNINDENAKRTVDRLVDFILKNR